MGDGDFTPNPSLPSPALIANLAIAGGCVTGASDLGSSGQLTQSDGDGSISDSGIATTTVVKGAAALTNANVALSVASAGTLQEGVATIKALTSAGVTVQNSSGASVAVMGAGPGQGVTFSDGVTVTSGMLTANNVAITGGSISGITDLAVADGGTGASDIAGAQTNLQVMDSTEFGNHGFVDNTETTYGFNDSTYVFTLTDAGGGWSYWRDGLKYTISGNKTTTLAGSPPTKGRYYISIDATDGTLSNSTTPWTLTDSKVPVAVVEWDNSLTPKYYLASERHTCAMNKIQHAYEHTTFGTRLQSSGAVSGYTIDTDTDAAKQYDTAQSIIWDEDLQITNAATTGGVDNYTVIYQASGDWDWVESSVPFKAGTYIQYDNAGTMTDASNGKYVNTWQVETNYDGLGRRIIVTGQTLHDNLTSALAEAFSDLDLTGIPLSEAVALYKFIWRCSSSFTSTGKCVLDIDPIVVNTNITTAPSAPSLGTMSTQDADNVAITGGSATGLTNVSATTVAADNFNALSSASSYDATGHTFKISSTSAVVIDADGLQLAGDGDWLSGNSQSSTEVNLVRGNRYGYVGSEYTVAQVGADAGIVAIGVDPSAVASGNFTGSKEIIVDRGVTVLVPNSGDTDWEGPLRLSGGGAYNAPIADISSTGVSISATTASTSTSTGSIVTAGGIGAAGAIFSDTITFSGLNATKNCVNLRHGNGAVAETGILFSNTYFTSGYGMAAIYGQDTGSSGGNLIFQVTANGGGVTGTPATAVTIAQNKDVSFASTTASSSTSTGSIVTAGGIGVAGAIYAGGVVQCVGLNNGAGGANGYWSSGGILYVLNTTASTSTTSGCAQFSGGIGVAGDIYGASSLHISSKTNLNADVNSCYFSQNSTNASSGNYIQNGYAHQIWADSSAGNLYIRHGATGTAGNPVSWTNIVQINSSGYFMLTSLPTSASGLPTGALWNNGGVVNVA